MIVARNLTKAFAGHRVLDDVSIALADASLSLLVGPSGAGKSTLLRILAGLDQPDGGVVELDGRPANGPEGCIAPHQRGIGFVFQSPTLWPHMTVAGNVAFALARGSKRARKEVALAVLEAVGIADLAARYPAQISQGQAHRVALARALAPKPRHLFLDEPFANLDEATRADLLQLVTGQISERRAAVLLVTHDRAEMRQLGGTLFRLEHGRLTADAAQEGGG